MRTRLRQSRERALEAMLQTRTHAWDEAGLSRQLRPRSAARRARREVLVLLPLLAARARRLLERERLFGGSTRRAPRCGASCWSPSAGRWPATSAASSRPRLFRRMDPATAGTVGFLIRLVRS